MRRRIKPLVVAVFFALIALMLIVGKIHANYLQKQTLNKARASIPTTTKQSSKTTTSSTEKKSLSLIQSSMFLAGNYQVRSITIPYLKIFPVQLFVFMEDHK